MFGLWGCEVWQLHRRDRASTRTDSSDVANDSGALESQDPSHPDLNVMDSLSDDDSRWSRFICPFSLRLLLFVSLFKIKLSTDTLCSSPTVLPNVMCLWWGDFYPSLIDMLSIFRLALLGVESLISSHFPSDLRSLDMHYLSRASTAPKCNTRFNDVILLYHF